MIKHVRMIILFFVTIMVATLTTAKANPSPKTNQCFPDLTQSNISEATLLVWSNEAAVAAFTYNFVNYKTQLQTVSNYFTPNGWKEFYKALEQSNNLDAVKAKKLLVTAAAIRAPIITQAGVLDGRYSWRVEIPLKVTFQNNFEYAQQSVKVAVLIARATPYEGVRGLVILQFVVNPLPQEEDSSNSQKPEPFN